MQNTLLKKSFYIIFILAFSISFIQSAEAKIYIDDEYFFWLEYPDYWYFEDTKVYLEPIPGVNSGATIFPSFRDGPFLWEHFVSVTLHKNHTLANYHDEQFFQMVKEDLENSCKLASFDLQGYQCDNHLVLETEKIQVDKNQAYQITEKWTEYYPDGTNSTKIGVITDIIIKNDLWQIDSIIIEDIYDENIDRINEIINSFKFLEESEAAKHITIKKIPDWVRNNAHWWSEGIVTDKEFAQGLQFLINKKVIVVAFTSQETDMELNEIPPWIKKSAGWWADGLVDDDSFIQGIQYMIKEGIIKIV